MTYTDRITAEMEAQGWEIHQHRAPDQWHVTAVKGDQSVTASSILLKAAISEVHRQVKYRPELRRTI